jgi:hypothetical protein
VGGRGHPLPLGGGERSPTAGGIAAGGIISEFETQRIENESNCDLIANSAAKYGRSVVGTSSRSWPPAERRLKHFVITTDLRIRNIGVYYNPRIDEHTTNQERILKWSSIKDHAASGF